MLNYVNGRFVRSSRDFRDKTVDECLLLELEAKKPLRSTVRGEAAA